MKALLQPEARKPRAPLDATAFAAVLARAEADFVVIDGAMLHAQYTREPDGQTRADDIVLEAGTSAAGESEVDVSLTLSEVAGAEDLGEGKLRLRNGSLLQFLSAATIH